MQFQYNIIRIDFQHLTRANFLFTQQPSREPTWAILTK